MMHLRGHVLFLLCLAGGARRSIHIDDSDHKAQQHNNMLANGFELSAKGRETFSPSGFETGIFRPADVVYKPPMPSISELVPNQAAKRGHARLAGMLAKRQSWERQVFWQSSDGVGKFVDTTDLELQFLQFREGEEGAARIIDALEATAQVPDGPRELQEELLGEELSGYFAVKFASGEGAFPEAGLTSAKADGRVLTGHFLRFAPLDSKEPSLQCVEVLRDPVIGRAQVATLKGTYRTVTGMELGGGQDRSHSKLGPSVCEVYDKLVTGGEFQSEFVPGSVQRSWSCTFLGKLLLFARIYPGGGVVVYERRSRAEAMAEVERLLEDPPPGPGGGGDIMELVRQLMLGAGPGDRRSSSTP